jgi:phosphoribosyl 1,2-cyclic phosphate phosphodiesterase
MKITILGSGSSNPVPYLSCRCETCRAAREDGVKSRRTRASMLIEHKNRTVLIDCGPDFKKQIKRLPEHAKQTIDACVITHAHVDACGGLKFLNELAENQDTYIFLYLLEGTARRIKHLSRFKRLKTVYLKPANPVTEGKITITPIPVRHGMKNTHYPTLGYRINDIIYASDCAGTESEYLKYFHKARYVFLDGSMWFGTQIRGHFNVVSAIDFANKIHAKKVYLTHIGHSYPIHENAEKEVKKYALLKNKKMEVNLAYDGLKID